MDNYSWGIHPGLHSLEDGFIGMKVPSGTTFDISFLTSAQSSTNANSYAFTSQDFGVADVSRYIGIGVVCNGNPGALSGAIGTITWTEHGSIDDGECRTELGSSAVPTGTSGTVNVTANSASGCGIGLWRLVGLASQTASDVASDQVTTGDDLLSASITIPTGGGAFAVGGFDDIEGSNRTAVWTEFTEGYDAVIETATMHTGASSLTAGTPTVTVEWANGTENSSGLIIAAWEAA